MRRAPGAIAGVLAVLALAGAAGWLWYTQPQPLLPEAAGSLASTDAVTFVRNGDRLEWTPVDNDYATGLVLYPGGKVPAAAYGPAARAIAAEGYLVIAMPMPFNLAVLGIGAADEAVAAHPEVSTWAVGGHSLGGAMAAQYAADHDDVVAGLVLWAAYPATDLSSAGLRAVSVYGNLDVGAARMSGAEARAQLPPDTEFVAIEGGNHEQMGWYTGQPDDPPATIARDAQQAQVVDATVRLLAGLDEP